MYTTHSSQGIKFGSRLFSLIILSLLLASCALPAPVALPTTAPLGPSPLPPLTSTPTATSLVLAPLPSDTPIPPSDTPVIAPLPTDTLTFTPTPQPVAVSAASTGSIAFAPGTTAGVVQGTVLAGQVLTYTLSASQGQTMVLILTSPNSDVTLGVFAPNGATLLNPANKINRWQILLPSTGLYTIQVTGGATTETFNLTAKVAQVVNFAAGASSITLNGTTVSGFLFSYSFACQAGQTMTASLNVPSTTAYIDIYGIATGTLLSAATKANSFTGVLPQTQVYVIEVVPVNGQVINYALTVSVTSTGAVVTPAPGTPAPGGTSIVFQTGTTMGSVSGTVQAGQVVTYTINAGAGLPMILDVSSTNGDVFLGVIQPDGLVLLKSSNHWNHWQWMLPESGIYKIQVVGGAVAENFTLTARIPVRASFAAGASSMILNGSTVGGLVFSYTLACAANQTMTVNLNAAAGAAHLDIFGVSSGTLLNSSANATSWTVVLPKSEDYVVEVIPNAGQVVSYALTITVTSPTTSTATNIAFTPGTTAAEIKGTIQPGQVISYTLSAAQWQPMTLILESPNFDVYLGVYEPNSNAVVPPGNHWVHWQGLLPNTETYTIQVNGGATTENYTLTVKIPVRVQFSLGQSSITLYGTNVNGYVFSYAFRANAGQEMTVTLNQPSTVAYIDVVGIATGALLSPADKANEWTGVLPMYQDYIIEVIPRQGQLMSYGLTVTIH